MNTAENQAAAHEAKKIMADPIVMEFVKKAAFEKVAAEMQGKGYSCTAKAVELLSARYKNIEARVNHYIAAGVVGCVMAKFAN